MRHTVLLGSLVVLAVVVLLDREIRTDSPSRRAEPDPPIEQFRAATDSELVKRLSDSRGKWRRAAMFELGRRGESASSAAEPVIAALEKADARDRFFAVEALSRLAPADSRVVSSVLSRLSDSDSAVRQAAIEYATRPDLPLVDALRRMARSGPLQDQEAALTMLSVRGEITEDLAPLVISWMNNSADSDTRRSAIAWAAQIAEHPAVFEALLECCRRGSVVDAFVVALSLSVPRGAAYEDRLRELANNAPNPRVRLAAENALGKIRNSESRRQGKPRR